MQNENNEIKNINRCRNCGDALKEAPVKNYYGLNRGFHKKCRGEKLNVYTIRKHHFNFVHKGNQKIENDDDMRQEAYSKWLRGVEYGRKKKYGY